MAINSDKLREMAIIVIHNYYDGYYTKEYIEENFNLAIDLMAENASCKVSGASAISENGTSITYTVDSANKFSINADVKALLPKKKNFKAW